MAASAAAMLWDRRLLGSPETPIAAHGYGTDPDLTRSYKPGDLWPLTMTAAHRRTASALCAVIVPADASSPSAADLNVPDFIDEWISAPYSGHDKDRDVVLDGLAWMDAEASRRFGLDFAGCVHSQMAAICDDICTDKPADPAWDGAAKFFARFRDLTTGGFYSTPEGMKDIGYIGNVPLAKFDGPPPELLRRLGIID
jgi:hypothetical protein